MNPLIYHKKVLGCWLGKAVGGTLGAPVEGHPGPLNLDFYRPVPTAMLPNDDLDLQIVWAWALTGNPTVNRHLFEKCWLDNIGFPWDEYAVAVRNLRNGIHAPFSGSYDNYFTDGMGSAIRSEIWACLAPGDPKLAARLAGEDACVDHARDGMWAEIFLAAMESAAFVDNDVRRIIQSGLEQIPGDCRLAEAIADAVRWYDQTPEFGWLFDNIMKKYQSDNFTDVKINLPIIVAGLLLGQGDFGKTLCDTVNFGQDTDCTGATVGALLGIMDPGAIPEKWLAPIGRNLVLSPGITGVTFPPTVDGFAELVCKLRDKVRLDPQPAASFRPRPVHALAAVTPWGYPREPDTPVEFAGTFGQWPEILPNAYDLTLVFQFAVPYTGDYIVMFNTKSQVTVLVDGQLAFRRSTGEMAPSFHRAPWNQSAKLRLTGGKHIIRAMIVPGNRQKAEWVVGIADADTLQWVPDAML